MKPLKLLLELQKIDADLHFLRELRVRRPQEVQKERDKLQRSEQAVASIESDIKQLRMTCDRAELDIKQKQGEIEKLQIALNTAKTNQEYQVLRDQIERHGKELGEIEEQVLERFNSIDALGEEKTAARDEVERARKELAAREEEMRGIVAEVDEKIAALDKQRAEKVAEIPGDALETYERVLARYEDSALALVESRICQGCYMSVTSQAINELMVGEELIQCKNCLRILYLPEAAS